MINFCCGPLPRTKWVAQEIGVAVSMMTVFKCTNKISECYLFETNALEIKVYTPKAQELSTHVPVIDLLKVNVGDIESDF